MICNNPGQDLKLELYYNKALPALDHAEPSPCSQATVPATDSQLRDAGLSPESLNPLSTLEEDSIAIWQCVHVWVNTIIFLHAERTLNAAHASTMSMR